MAKHIAILAVNVETPDEGDAEQTIAAITSILERTVSMLPQGGKPWLWVVDHKSITPEVASKLNALMGIDAALKLIGFDALSSAATPITLEGMGGMGVVR